MNLLPQAIQALRDAPDGVPRLFIHHRAPHRRAAAEMLGGAERSTYPLHDAFATRAATPFRPARDAGRIALPATSRSTSPIQSP